MPYQFELSQQVNQPPERVFFAFTNSPMLATWWCDWAFLTPNRGHTLYMYWETGFQAMGQYTELRSPEYIAFTWVDGASPPCKAAVTLTASDGGTRVDLAFSEIDNEDQARQLEKHWRDGLENLASVLETGADLRETRRPMMGVYLGDLVGEDTAERYGASHGIVLEGTLEGLSAEAAGLKGGDVLIEADGQPLKEYSDLMQVMEGRVVGEVVEVAYLRNGEQHTAAMELKTQHIPEIPRDPNELADQLAAKYAEANQVLAEVLDGVSEEQAAIVPAPDEWSIRQIVAHLIANERDEQTTIGMQVGGFGDVFSYNNNSLVRIEPLLANYPTMPELLDALQRTQAETVAAVRHLPADFVERRGSYDRLGRVLLEDADSHYGLHVEQIEGAKEAALAGG